MLFSIDALQLRFFLYAVPPKVILSSRKVTILMGNRVVVRCNGAGTPEPNVINWFVPLKGFDGNVTIDTTEAVHQVKRNGGSDLIFTTVICLKYLHIDSLATSTKFFN